ncbi:hypothetical protein QFC19_000446 [Naganishia cerealis]|uniref:Uncharacterized protein n=1 Tax=Naganishia cerealis TaxID=610337 RepID=A0ACC2WP64_9TREE|nr:hypothetical protein QFC19_000446 [Naganishia cerealis]
MEHANTALPGVRCEQVDAVSRERDVQDSLAEAFRLATTAISDPESPLSLTRHRLDPRYSLSFYALFQQATKGDLIEDNGASFTGSPGTDVPKKPGLLDLRGKAQWAAWKQVQGISKEEAQMARKAKLQCTSEEQAAVQQTISRMLTLLDAAGEGHDHRAEKFSSWAGTPQFEMPKQPSPLQTEATSRSSFRTKSRSVSISGSATESETESESWLSSRESIDVDDIDSKPSTKQEKDTVHGTRLQGLIDAAGYGHIVAENEDEISLGGDAWSYSRSQSRRASVPKMGYLPANSGSIASRRKHEFPLPTPVDPPHVDQSNIPTRPHYEVEPRTTAQSLLPPTNSLMAALHASQRQHSYPLGLQTLVNSRADSVPGRLSTNDNLQQQRLSSPIAYTTRQIENRYLSPDFNLMGTTPRRYPLLSRDRQPDTSPRVNTNLVESVHAIQVSLTALHERMAALEHMQSLALTAVRPEENPWIALLRGLGILASRDGNGQLREDGVRRRGWVGRLLLRLMVTARRAIVDISFILVILCMYKASWSAIRRRMRFGSAMAEEGGRKAIVEFWKSVAAMAGRVGGMWGSD